MPLSGAPESSYELTFSSGLQVSAPSVQLLKDKRGTVWYLQAQGATTLGFADSPLPGHGVEQHPEGFGSPVGRLAGGRQCLSLYTDAQLAAAGIQPAQQCFLEFDSGVMVTGFLNEITRCAGRIILLSFSDCRVEDTDGKLLFDPDWGTYDMAVGEELDELSMKV